MTFYIAPSAVRTRRRKRLRATGTSPASVLAHAREEAGL